MNFIDLESSYVYAYPKSRDCIRLAVKSILLDVKENNYYYLTKECMAELMGMKPFDHPSKHEVCVIADSNKNSFVIRDIPVFKFDEFGPMYYETTKNADYEMHTNYCEYKNIDVKSVNQKLKQRNLQSLYTRFSYRYQNKEFAIFNY